jgi:hypothetical protein
VQRLAAKRDGAGARPQQPQDELERGRLACTVRPDEPEDLGLFHAQVEIPQRNEAPHRPVVAEILA